MLTSYCYNLVITICINTYYIYVINKDHIIMNKYILFICDK